MKHIFDSFGKWCWINNKFKIIHWTWIWCFITLNKTTFYMHYLFYCLFTKFRIKFFYLKIERIYFRSYERRLSNAKKLYWGEGEVEMVRFISKPSPSYIRTEMLWMQVAIWLKYRYCTIIFQLKRFFVESIKLQLALILSYAFSSLYIQNL
jgi:hypothetical protein